MSEEAKPGEGLTLLIVEDNPFQRRLAARILEKLGCACVLTASDGKDALGQLATLSSPVHIVLSDLDMPSMDGAALLCHLAKNRLVDAIAVVSGMETALVNTVEEMAGENGLRVLSSVTKPVTHDKMQQLIRQYRKREKSRAAKEPQQSFPVDEIIKGMEAGAFTTWYQPKVRITDGAWVSSEALVRWQHPCQGLVMPSQFIHVMEENGLIAQLTWLQIQAIVEDLRAWRNKYGRDFSVSINLSPSILQDTNFPCRLAQLIEQHNVPADNIIFEVTENSVMGDTAESLETLARLRIKGTTLSIDDFGTGFSGLMQLDRIPFSELKIDQLFIRNMDTKAASRTIVSSSLDLARRLHMTTVAEGIETLADWKRLASMGCDIAQGFWVARPMPAPTLFQWEQSWKRRYRTMLSK